MGIDAEGIAVKPPGPSFFDTEHLKTDLKGRSVQGATITVVAQGAKFALQLGSTVILARLLTPDDFGLIAMVTAITAFAVMFKDMGLSIATVQKPEINHAQVSTLFWINVGFGLFIAALLAVAAPLIARFYAQPQLTYVTWALCPAFIFGGLAVQHQALLRRRMRFFALGVIDLGAVGVSILAGVVAALCGVGYWALVIMHVTLAVATTAGVWMAMRWRPGWPRRGTGVRGMIGFGGNLTAFNILNYFARNLDNVLIGWYWGAAPLGLYSKAYSLMMLPIHQISAPLAAVAIPGLSCLHEEPARFRNYYLSVLSAIAFFAMPLCGFTILFAEELIAMVLGSQWLPAASIFRFLALSACFQPMYNCSGWLYLATGRTRELLRWGALGITLICSSFLIGLPFGPSGVAFAYSCAIAIWIYPWMRLSMRSTSFTVRDVFISTADSITGALIASAVAFCVKYILFGHVGVVMLTGLCLVILALVHCAVVFHVFGHRQRYVSILSLLRGTRIRAAMGQGGNGVSEFNLADLRLGSSSERKSRRSQ